MSLPFKGIKTRPYPQSELEMVDWHDGGLVPVQTVKFRDIWLTQPKLTIPGLFRVDAYSTDWQLRLVEFNNELYLEDGHHRICKMALRGYLSWDFRVWQWETLHGRKHKTCIDVTNMIKPPRTEWVCRYECGDGYE